MALCDAKKLLSRIRTEFQARKLKTTLSEADIVEAMKEVPDDVKKVLKLIQGLAKDSGASRKPRKVAPLSTAVTDAVPAKGKTGGTSG